MIRATDALVRLHMCFCVILANVCQQELLSGDGSIDEILGFGQVVAITGFAIGREKIPNSKKGNMIKLERGHHSSQFGTVLVCYAIRHSEKLYELQFVSLLEEKGEAITA